MQNIIIDAGKLERPKSIWRGTLSEIETKPLPHSGVYIIAYLGRIIYIGKAIEVGDRLRQHATPAGHMVDFDNWFQVVALSDPQNVRLDILENPNGNSYWNTRAESACIQYFRPLLNVQINY